MEHTQLIRILNLDSDSIRLSDEGRLMPPESVACYGLHFCKDINKADCKFCIFYKEKTYFRTNYLVEIDTSDVKAFRSNITNRFLCPMCINKNIDLIDEKIYFKKNLNFILDLYEKIQNETLKMNNVDKWNYMYF